MICIFQYKLPKSRGFVNDKPKLKKMFLDIPHAAALAGFSVRQFHKRIKDDGLRVIPIKRKFFILSNDFENWQNSRKNAS